MRNVTNTQKPRLRSQIQKFIRYYTFFVAVEREKKRMKNESTTLTRQSETKCHEDKKRRGRTLIFSHVFYCSSNTCFLAGSIITDSRLVWDPPFSKLTPKNGARNFCLSLLSSLLRCVSQPTDSHPRVAPLLPLAGSGKETYPFQVVQHLRRWFGTPGVFLSRF